GGRDPAPAASRAAGRQVRGSSSAARSIREPMLVGAGGRGGAAEGAADPGRPVHAANGRGSSEEGMGGGGGVIRDYCRCGTARAPSAGDGQHLIDLVRAGGFRPKTGPGRSGVTAVDGVTARRGEEWTAFVNGVEPDDDLAKTDLHDGDRLQLDLRPAAATPAV